MGEERSLRNILAGDIAASQQDRQHEADKIDSSLRHAGRSPADFFSEADATARCAEFLVLAAEKHIRPDPLKLEATTPARILNERERIHGGAINFDDIERMHRPSPQTPSLSMYYRQSTPISRFKKSRLRSEREIQHARDGWRVLWQGSGYAIGTVAFADNPSLPLYKDNPFVPNVAYLCTDGLFRCTRSYALYPKSKAAGTGAIPQGFTVRPGKYVNDESYVVFEKLPLQEKLLDILRSSRM